MNAFLLGYILKLSEDSFQLPVDSAGSHTGHFFVGFVICAVSSLFPWVVSLQKFVGTRVVVEVQHGGFAFALCSV